MEKTRFELSLEDLQVHFKVKKPFFRNLISRDREVVHAVDGVSLRIGEGEILGLVGESGSGKTTLGRSIVRLIEPTSGHLLLNGRDITHLSESRIRPLRRQMQIIFQDPYASLNPAMTLGQAIAHPLKIHGITKNKTREEIRSIVLNAMREVGLSPEDQLYTKYPGDVSGGQRQRAAIARALVLTPRLIVADEPVAMLDMSIRAKVLQLMLDLRSKFNLAYLFITHDLATARFVCDSIAIMYLGRVVESGPTESIFSNPKHPYTRALLQAIPIPDPRKRHERTLPLGEVPDAINPPAGCRFHPRCLSVLPTCGWEGQDFINYLELRRVNPEKSALDEQALGPIDKWKAEKFTAILRTVDHHSESIVQYVKKILTEAQPQMQQAVETVSANNERVTLVFRQPEKLAQTKVDGQVVECLLYQ